MKPPVSIEYLDSFSSANYLQVASLPEHAHLFAEVSIS